MRGWLRYFALNAQVRTGVSGWVLAWALIAAAAAAAAAVFLLVAAFVWLADRYGSLTAGVVLGCAFALIALIALLACLMTRRRNIERARLELAARNTTSWLDPKLVAVGVQIGQAIGWRRGLEPIDAEAGTNRADQPSASLVSSASARCRSRG